MNYNYYADWVDGSCKCCVSFGWITSFAAAEGSAGSTELVPGSKSGVLACVLSTVLSSKFSFVEFGSLSSMLITSLTSSSSLRSNLRSLLCTQRLTFNLEFGTLVTGAWTFSKLWQGEFSC